MARSTRKARDAAAGTGNTGADGQRRSDADDTGDDGDDLDSLLDGDDGDDEDGDDDEDDGDDDDDDEDDDEDGTSKTAKRPKYMTSADVESALDRRINVVLREIRKQGGTKEDRRGGGSSQRDRSGSGRTQTPVGPTAADLRDARASYREYVNDEISFLDSAERQHASTIASGLIRERMADGADPDEVGEEVARQVAGQIKSLRSLYTKQVVGRLRRKGRITGGSTSQPVPGRKSGPGASSQYKAGEQRAKEMYAARLQNQTNTTDA